MKNFNLMIVGKHTEAILNSLEKLNERLQYFCVNANLVTAAIVAEYQTLGGKMVVNVQDRITEVLTATGIIAVDNKKFNTVNTIMDRVTTEANLPTLGYNGNVNDWLIYNGINQYLFSDRTIAAPEKRVEKDSKVLEYMLRTAKPSLAI